MDALLLGLRLATIILFTAILMEYVRNTEQLSHVHVLRRKAMTCIALGIVVGFSPPRVFELMEHPLHPWLSDSLRIVGLLCSLSGAVIWAKTVVLLRGGTDKDVRRSMIVFSVLIILCLVTGGILR